MRSFPLCTLLLLMALHCAGKEPTLNRPRLALPGHSAPGYGTNGRGLHFFSNIQLGYSSGSSTTPTDTTTEGGFMYSVEAGASINLSYRETRYNVLSFSLSYTGARMSKYNLELISLPISYTSIGTGRNGGIGFYWQAGAALRYVVGANMGNKDVKLGFNRFLADPFVSVGITGPFLVLNHRGGDEIGGGRYMLGPCFSYTPMNMFKAGGEMHGYMLGMFKAGGEMHGYMLGLRWQYFFM